jgi:hypothetical protein
MATKFMPALNGSTTALISMTPSSMRRATRFLTVPSATPNSCAMKVKGVLPSFFRYERIAISSCFNTGEPFTNFAPMHNNIYEYRNVLPIHVRIPQYSILHSTNNAIILLNEKIFFEDARKSHGTGSPPPQESPPCS